MSPALAEISGFHFLRPQWLWALAVIGVLALLLWRQQSAAQRWKGLIAPHLLEHLIVQPQRGLWVRPWQLLTVVLSLAAIAAAGPSWRREPPPFTQDTAPLVLALDLSRSMLAEDIQPSRLARAQQKARDLLAERGGAKTALLVYAGTAHMVLPLTEDPRVLEAYLTSLDPSIMPVDGKEPGTALAVAETMLADEPTPGTILFLTDGVTLSATTAFAAHASASKNQVAVLAVGTEAGGPVPLANRRMGDISKLDRAGLEALERQAGAFVTTVTVDDTDIRRLNRRIASHLTAVQQEDSEGRWRDEGWWLVLPLIVLTLAWFRRGWVVQWES